MDIKVCSTCKTPKPLTEYWRSRRRPDGYGPRCKDCRRRLESEYSKAYYKRHYAANKEARLRWQREYTYGITHEDFEAMVARQNGLCAICRQVLPLHVDHCHETKAVRGLLCQLCNVGLGHFKDNPERLQRAASYLEQNAKP